MVKFEKDHDSLSFNVFLDQRKIKSFLPYGEHEIQNFNNKSVKLGDIVGFILNSKALDDYHKYYGTSLRNTSLYAKSREWNEPVKATSYTDIDWISLLWKVTWPDNNHIQFNSELFGFYIDNSNHRVIDNLEDTNLLDLHSVPLYVDEDINIDTKNVKRRFKVCHLLRSIFNKL